MATIAQMLVGAGISLISVLVASLLTFRLQARQDVARWDRENKVRFHAERMQAYAQVMTLASRLNIEFLQLATLEGDARRKAADSLKPTMLECLSNAHTLALLASPAVAEVLARLFEIPQSYLGYLAEKDENARLGYFLLAHKRVTALTTELAEQVKKELGTYSTTS